MKPLIAHAVDVAAVPAVYVSGHILKLARRAGFERLPFCRRALLSVGVFPIRNHYYEPLFDGRQLLHPLSDVRPLPGIDWNVEEQLALLREFSFNAELEKLPLRPPSSTPHNSTPRRFFLENPTFGPGDAEFLYNLIRLKKPRRIIEIGSGNSTLLAIAALAANTREDATYRCHHLCIEPYEMPWLEAAPVEVLRRRVEQVDQIVFAGLEANDLLFIDSSHVIRPQGDVVCEYLEILPTLRPGVIVHIHDIFTPRDYPSRWVVDEVRLWTEQYLVEAFLSHNADWKIIGALNFLSHEHYPELAAKCPHLRPTSKPGSFYLQRVR